MNGRTAKITIAPPRARTPKSLSGIARRIAYANRKYHSGTICAGVTIGSASIQLSGCPRSLGAKNTYREKNRMKASPPKRSFAVKYGWKVILSTFEIVPSGFEEPCW